MANSELGARDQRKTRHTPCPQKSRSLLRKRDPLLLQSSGTEFLTRPMAEREKRASYSLRGLGGISGRDGT